jgi:AraC-like DNA-binding protein
VRVVLPRFLVEALASHPLARDLYPLAFGHYPRARGHAMAREHHDDGLLLYCTAGRGWLETAAGRENIAAGSLVILPPGTAHRYAADRRDPWTLWWAHFEGSALPAVLDHLGARERRVLPAGLHAGAISDFRALLAVRQTGFAVEPYVYAAAQLRALLAFFALQVPRGRERRRDTLDVERVTAWMREHVEQPLDLPGIAAATSELSLFHFARRFRAATGMSPIQYFIHLRMEHACRLLDSTDTPVHGVARQLGYEDPYYFSRLFRKVIGLSPSDYRRLARG